MRVCAFFLLAAGTVLNYLSFHISYSMLFYTVFLLWSTVFPFHYREAKISGRVKRSFIAALVTSFIAPTTCLFVLKDGYFSAFYLFDPCTPQNPTDFYIAVTLHQSLLLWVTTSLLVIIMWKIFKVPID